MAGVDSGSILTIYRGLDAEKARADDAAGALSTGTPGMQVDQVFGGQPYYHYLASIE